MSTIRRHGVAFLLPTLGEGLWLEVIRELDGAVLVTEEYSGHGEGDFAAAVDEWFAELVFTRLERMDFPVCRLCGERRRTVRHDDNGWIATDHLVEWEFDLCLPCASQMETASPWIRRYLQERYQPANTDDDDDW